MVNLSGESGSGNTFALILTTLFNLDNSSLLKFIVGNIVENDVLRIDKYLRRIVLDIFLQLELISKSLASNPLNSNKGSFLITLSILYLIDRSFCDLINFEST